MVREKGRMSREEAFAAGYRPKGKARADLTPAIEVAAFTPKGWEDKIGSVLLQARNTYGGPADEGYPDAGYWRDLDRSNPKENAKRMPGHLDYLYWRIYAAWEDFPADLVAALPFWKGEAIKRAYDVRNRYQGLAGGLDFDLYLECKTGQGKPNEEQRRTLRRLERNPGAHGFVVYPHDLPWVRAISGVV